ncbi:conjugative transposon protein TraM [Flagellimonas flava]|uniref:conjugative transposon protein TraM n=1 Tax=Flagellimonas flava TaxID=570519 RepID=UPI003D653A44
MKAHNNKIIFIAVIVAVIFLMVGYYVTAVAKDDSAQEELLQTEVPTLEERQKEYSSKLEAVNDVKEEKEKTAPSVYSDIDSTGLYDPDLEEKRRQKLVDSIYRHGRINYTQVPEKGVPNTYQIGIKSRAPSKNEVRETRDFSQAHAAFFNSVPTTATPEADLDLPSTDAFIVVEVNGEQTIRQNERLELRLAVDAEIGGEVVPRNTLVYGFITFQPNRVLLDITNIEHRKVSLKAYDLLDGNEGIYIRNSFRAEAQREVLDDVVQDINVPGMPQVGGIKQVFRRNNRNVRVTVRNQYQLILKGG